MNHNIDIKEKHLSLTRETELEDVMALLYAIGLIWIVVDTFVAWASL